ncbi:MAG: hypothetical protein LWY06_03505 [Firmicutes bacterium]|nr:hypothetical protein [Bacillota bacterium]
MKKHTVLIIISFTLITAATIWLFHRELVFSTYCHCFNQVSYKIRNQQTSQKSFKFYAEAGAYLGELMTKYQKHFEPVIFEYLRSSNEEKAMHAYNILAEGNTIPDY